VFVAIPLETFVHSLRTVLGIIGSACLRAVAFGLRLIGNLFRYAGRVLVNLYDLVIFGPLWIENTLSRKGTAVKPTAPKHSINADYQEAA
jgi:F0F1-type ATP synthase membrane subunit a